MLTAMYREVHMVALAAKDKRSTAVSLSAVQQVFGLVATGLVLVHQPAAAVCAMVAGLLVSMYSSFSLISAKVEIMDGGRDKLRQLSNLLFGLVVLAGIAARLSLGPAGLGVYSATLLIGMVAFWRLPSYWNRGGRRNRHATQYIYRTCLTLNATVAALAMTYYAMHFYGTAALSVGIILTASYTVAAHEVVSRLMVRA